MQRGQVLQLNSVEWHFHCLLENILLENILFRVEKNVTLNIIFLKSVQKNELV